MDGIYTPAASRLSEAMRLEQTAAAGSYAGNEQTKLTLSGYLEFSANSESIITTAE